MAAHLGTLVSYSDSSTSDDEFQVSLPDPVKENEQNLKRKLSDNEAISLVPEKQVKVIKTR